MPPASPPSTSGPGDHDQTSPHQRTRPRSGLSLPVKLTLATMAVVAAAVGAAAFFSLRAINDLASRDAAERRRAGEADIQRESEAMARVIASSAGLPLSQNAFKYMEGLVAETVAGNSRVKWMLIADAESNKILIRSSTPDTPKDEVLSDSLLAEVAKAGADDVKSLRDPRDPTRITFGAKLEVVAEDTGQPLTVGQLRLGVSTAALEAELKQAIANARARANAAARTLALIAAGIIMLGALLAVWEGRRIAQPVKALSDQAEKIAGGDFQQRVNIGSRDEIGRLADSFNFMADQLGVLMRATAEKASLDREMALARNVQEAMNPPPGLITHGGLSVVGHCESANFCGGDWWTVRKLPRDRVLVVVGDVTGHGVSSAMIAASARGAVEALSTVNDELLTPEEVLRAMDGAVRDLGKQKLLMTCFAALIDSARGVIEFANAGQNFPYILHAGQRVGPDDATPALTVLTVRGNVLGDPQRSLVQSGRRDLSPGDIFVCFTDGVVDRVNGEGKRFGDRQLQKLLKGTEVRRDQELVALRDTILQQLTAFAAGTPADDDVTLVLVQYNPAVAHLSPEASSPRRAVLR